MRILVVEDDSRLNDALCQILTEQKYMVDAVYDGKNAYDYGVLGIYDVIILDFPAGLDFYLYNVIVARSLFKEYQDEQFLAMFGMLTGTASTGVMLLREVDPEFKTPVQDNLVYQTLPAILFGFPIMLIAPMTPNSPFLIVGLLVVFFIVLNVILFRSKIFSKTNKANKEKE
jgi:ESS family glutamate:Na+ symporter